MKTVGRPAKRTVTCPRCGEQVGEWYLSRHLAHACEGGEPERKVIIK